MKDFYELSGERTEFRDGIFIGANYASRLGKIKLVAHEGLIVGDRTEESVYFHMLGTEWMGCSEPPSYNCRELAPYDRQDETMIPLGYNKLDVIGLSNQGRFLSQKMPREINLSIAAPKSKKGWVAMNWGIDEKGQIRKYLEELLLEMGVPNRDKRKIVDDIWKKMQF
ncbi:hypothetical protein HZB00_02645 [Candidatus Woesearchaeota archaeon]|nr:hypothetical protein [Candidatus Woesearchaeota archaeon]